MMARASDARWAPVRARGSALVCWVICGALSLPQSARGASVGTNVSGPATGDAASTFWNPAAMTLIEGTEAMLYGGVILIRAHYQRDFLDPAGEPYPQANLLGPTPEFFVGAVTDATLDRFRFGIGVTPPLIDGAAWNTTEDGQPSPVRYYGASSYIAWLTVSPAVAYRFNRFISVGLGVDVVIGLMRSRSVIDFGAKANQLLCQALGSSAAPCLVDAPLPREDPAYDAPVSADGSTVGVGVFGGVLVQVAPWLRFGASIHSGAGTLDFPVSVSLELPTAITDFVAQNLPSVTLPPLEAEAELGIAFPTLVAAGVLVAPHEKLDLAFDFQWLDKSKMSTMTAIVRREETTTELITDFVTYNPFHDYLRFNIVGAYRAHRDVVASLSFSYEPDIRSEHMVSPTTLDMHKLQLRVGVKWQVTPRIAIAADYGRFFVLARDVKVNVFAPNPNPVTKEEQALDRPPGTGRYWGEADRFAAGLLLHF